MFLLLLLWLFLSESFSRRCRLSRTTSNPAKKVGKNQAKICDRGPEQAVKMFLVNFFPTSPKNRCFQIFFYLGSADLHPKKSPWPDFRDRGVSIRARNASKTNSFLWGGQLVYLSYRWGAIVNTRYQGLWITFVHVLNAPPHTPRNYFPILSLSVGIDLDS